MFSQSKLPRIFLYLILLSLLVGCAVLPEKNQPIVWPMPPAEARVIYESTLRNQQSLNVVTREGRLRDLATGVSDRARRIMQKPYDVAARSGLVVVSDSLLGVVHVFDVSRKKLYQVGWRRSGILSKPLGVALDKNLNIYVADAGLGYVVKFDKQGHYLRTIGKQQDFSRIIDVAVNEEAGKVYVLDRGGVESLRHRVMVYSSGGELIDTIGTRGHADGEFNHPNQLAIDHLGKLIVLDAGNFRVQVFDGDGTFVKAWGRLGTQLGNLARPRGLGLDQSGNVYITDAAYQNFQIFNENGQLLLNIGSGEQKGAGQYLLPAGITVDETGRIYIVDQIKREVEVLKLIDK